MYVCMYVFLVCFHPLASLKLGAACLKGVSAKSFLNMEPHVLLSSSYQEAICYVIPAWIIFPCTFSC